MIDENPPENPPEIPKENPERQARILDAAMGLILHYGYDKTTVSDIARAAGVSKGAIYLHYASKEDLVEALFWREVWDYVDEWLALIDADPDWTFISMYEYALRVIAAKPLLQAMMRVDEQLLGSFLKKRGERFTAFKQPYQLELFHQMQALGAIRQDLDVKVLVYFIQIFSKGFLHAHEIDNADKPPMESVIMAYGQMLERFIFPPDGGNQEAGKAAIRSIVEAMRQQWQAHTQPGQVKKGLEDTHEQ